MNTIESIKTSLDSAHMVLKALLSDLPDADLMVRPVPNANHVAWQLGHLISSEHQTLEALKPGHAPKLPHGFSERYTKETSLLNEAAKFHSKEEYLALLDEQRRATLELLETFSERDFDRPAPEHMRDYAPTFGAALLVQGAHELMHAGQFSVLRRKLNRPVLF